MRPPERGVKDSGDGLRSKQRTPCPKDIHKLYTDHVFTLRFHKPRLKNRHMFLKYLIYMKK
jgi:hypothetical protein